jgi:hypothetical protein
VLHDRWPGGGRSVAVCVGMGVRTHWEADEHRRARPPGCWSRGLTRTTAAIRLTCGERRHPPQVRSGNGMSRPVSRVLFPGALRRSRSATIHLGVPSPARSSGPPAGSGGPPSNACAPPTLADRWLLDLAPGGVYLAAAVTRGAGGLLHHRFTLTDSARGRPAVCFLWHCPAAHAGLPLTTTLSCGARTFLDGPAPCGANPTRPPGRLIRG